MAKKHEAMPGARFGRLVVEKQYMRRYASTGGSVLMAFCRCDCGNVKVAAIANLGRRTNSCGCYHKEMVSTHGVSARNRRLYTIWHNMVNRCRNPNVKAYRNYGGRGIRVCREWASDVTKFAAWAKASGYRDGLTIDRKDTDGHYTPGNCRWIPMADQSGNRRGQQFYTAWGETKAVREWLEDCRCVVANRRTIRRRVHGLGWAPERALSTPV